MNQQNPSIWRQKTPAKQAPFQNADIATTFNQDLQMKATMNSTDSIELSETNEREMLRLIQQYLHSHGYSSVAQSLETESNIKMEESRVYDFREAVLTANYDAARDIVAAQSQGVSDEQWSQKVQYLLWEQQYMEMIESGRRIEAVNIMQREMMTRVDESGRARMHGLAQLLMVGAQPESSGKAIQQEFRRLVPMWNGSGKEGRADLLCKIQSIMPSSEMLKLNRLENLMKQALSYQFFNCKYHNVSTYGPQTGFSLLEDHVCDKQSMIPTKCIGILTKHRDEVWQVKFSPSGAKIATIGKDNFIYIWSISKSSSNQPSGTALKPQNSGFNNKNKYRIKCTHEIKGHSKQMNSINWSSDDKWIVTSSHDQTAKVWDAQRSGKLVVEITRHQEAVTAANFLFNNNEGTTKLITAAVDKLVILWDIRVASNHALGDSSSGPFIYEAVELARIESRNYLDLAVTQNRFVLMGSCHFQVFTYQSNDDLLKVFNDRDISYEVEIQDAPMTAIAISRDGRYLLANMSMKSPKLEVYDLGLPTQQGSKKCEVIRRLKGGHEQTQFILRCCFGGGPSEQFVVCGSEDASVSLWHREKGEIVARVSGGHTSVINSLSWSPNDAQLFVTASDDHTLRLWSTESTPQAEIVTDSKDLKRIDCLKTGAPSSRIYMTGVHSDQYQSESSEENRPQNYEDEEEAMEDDEQMIFRPIQSTRVLQATRVMPQGIREEEAEDEDEEDEDNDDWEMSGGARGFH